MTAAKTVAAAAAVTALMGAGQAFGAGAGENLDSRYETSAYAYSKAPNTSVGIADTAGDSMAVYTLYDRRYNTGLRLDNHDGNGTTRYSDADATNYISKVTACLNIQLNPDRCGPDDRPGDGR
ncbi:hypothetical protein [Streptomyces sp. cmx-10-25]|uniref:hypothetical protein n=1 Tax=Streptomyces sp. cmx-10-25 TaxID=2790919 RepID=UPI003981836B